MKHADKQLQKADESSCIRDGMCDSTSVRVLTWYSIIGQRRPESDFAQMDEVEAHVFEALPKEMVL